MDFGKFSPGMGKGPSSTASPFATVIYDCYNRDATGSSTLAAGDIVMFDIYQSASVSQTAADGTGVLPPVTKWGFGRDGVYGNVVKFPATDTHNTTAFAHHGVALAAALPAGPVRVMVSGETSVNLFSAQTAASETAHPKGSKAGPAAGAPPYGKAFVGTGAGTMLSMITKADATLSSASASTSVVPVIFNGIAGV